MDEITSFSGQYRCFSNFHRADVRPYFWPDPLPAFPGNEWAFVAWKVDPDSYGDYYIPMLAEILKSPTGAAVKAIGRKVRLRPEWDAIRIGVMKFLVHQKFANHKILGQILLATGDAELIEGNHWGDRFWGAEYDKDFGWVGENNLGKILMEVREELRNDRE